MDYKDTLLMPKTAFEMRGKLPNQRAEVCKSAGRMESCMKSTLERTVKGAKPFRSARRPSVCQRRHPHRACAEQDHQGRHRTFSLYGWLPVHRSFRDGIPTACRFETAITKLGHDRKKMPLS